MSDDNSELNAAISIRDKDNKRPKEDVLDWEEFYMGTAFLAGMRSKDPVTQVGACIVNEDKKIVATGYNGMPNGCSDDEFSWKKNKRIILDSKFTYVCHAELNAVMNKNNADIKNCTIYVGLFPCNECAKVIIQAGIKKIIYYSDKHSHKDTNKAAKIMFDAAGVEYKEYDRKLRNKIDIDFSEIVGDFGKRA